MNGQDRRPTILLFARKVLLIDLGIFIAVGVVCWLFGWRTLYNYGTGLLVVGIAVAGLGVLSQVGTSRRRGATLQNVHYTESRIS